MALIQVSGLTKSYGPKQVLRGVDLSVDEGEIVGILGPNGSGKTTAVECIGGLRTPDAGQIAVAGHDPRGAGAELRELLGMQLQQCRLPARIKVGEALALYSSFYTDPRPNEELLERFDLADQRGTRFVNLSGGQQQRLSVALALIGRPRIAFLDELTTGLDPSARRDIWSYLELLRGEGVTMILVTHFMEEAQYLCDRVVILSEGRIIAEGAPDEVAGSGGSQEISFDASTDNPLTELQELPAVTDVSVARGRVIVHGGEEAPQQVIAAMTQRGIPTQRLRITTPTLDDAFLSLTQHNHHEPEAPEEQ